MYVPSLSAKANAIVFRSERHTLSLGGFSRQEVVDRMAAWEEMIADDTPSARRVELFQDHQVEFILLSADRAWTQTLVSDFPERFSLVGKSGKLRLYLFTLEQRSSRAYDSEAHLNKFYLRTQVAHPESPQVVFITIRPHSALNYRPPAPESILVPSPSTLALSLTQ